LQLSAPTLLSVGHLIADKGHQLAIEALTGLPQANLIVIGDGPLRAELVALAARLGVASRVRWVGTIAQPELAKYYLAADVTVLASTSEGMANVLLESLACGTPVIATDVGGNAEVVSSAAVGALLKERSAAAIVDAFGKLDLSDSGRARARAHAQQFGWGPTVQGLLDLFESVCNRAGAGVNPAAARAPSN
jgi:teichuronic acid biosynthesis glycosyltransferase TuaC